MLFVFILKNAPLSVRRYGWREARPPPAIASPPLTLRHQFPGYVLRFAAVQTE
ncbi:hypothetical protein KCP73_00415 [Salmonella enterica subsp. enterica]|nr:hypothetical protein KCP73_00415 [Salmonella enterica subsp. enterica]